MKRLSSWMVEILDNDFPLGKLIWTEVLILIAFSVINALFGIWLWPYTVNSWLVWLQRPPTFLWWQGAILGFIPFFGSVTVPAAVITWLLMLFIG